MTHLDNYCTRVANQKNRELADTIRDTAEEAYRSYIGNFSFLEHKVGLLFGNVQSGKTGQVFGVICKAADEGFPVFLMLTTDNVVLYEQTLERVKDDLRDFCVCGEKNETAFRENEFLEPTVVVLKKNFNILRQWVNIIGSTGYMTGNPLFVIDDEADASSLNTLVNRDRQSSINRYLSMIKECASSSIYLQVTGTPQSLLLQTQVSGWHPDFVQYFKPGRTYLGGDFYFPRGEKPACITYTDSLKDPVRDAVMRHLAVTALLFSEGKTVCNCLIHPSVRQAQHETYANEVATVLSEFRDNPQEFAQEMYDVFWDIDCRGKETSLLVNMCTSLLTDDDTKIIIMNGQHDIDSDDYSHGCNFIVGGNTLGRGVTFPQLQTIIYTRTSRNPQADTMWQHSRMFGYDRDPSLVMVYMSMNLYKLFSDISQTNNSVIAQVERGVSDIKVYYPEGLRPTRRNVLDRRRVDMIAGGTNYYPDDPDNDDVSLITNLLAPFTGDDAYQVTLRLASELMSHIIPSPDFNLAAFLSIFRTMLAEKPLSQAMLIVRRGRHVTQGTGALLSASDWALSNSYKDKVVLTMYQIEGEHGWKQPGLWVPNVRLPDGVVYYDVKNEEE